MYIQVYTTLGRMSIFSQPSGALGTTGTWASQNDSTFGNFATTYDDFSSANNAWITDVHWQGTYFDGGPAGDVIPGTITAFTLTFYADNGGQPGAVLVTDTIAGNAGETSLGLAFFGPAYGYDTLLTSPFHAAPGTTYWLSIVPDSEFPPQWGWNNVNGGSSVQDFQGTRFFRNNNLVFDLTGTVPEPTTLILLGTGLGVVAYRRRRKR